MKSISSPVSFSLAQLLDGFVSNVESISSDTDVTGLAWDSRAVKPGDLFFACDGENMHGKSFVASAVDAGASAIALETSDAHEALMLSEKYNGLPVVPVAELTGKLGFIASRFYGNPSAKFSLIGVTGTNGKTSCTHLLAQCLNSAEHPCGVIGTMGAGLWGQLQNVQNTTPGAVELQQWLYQLSEQHADYVAMEVSSHGLEQGRTNACAFDIAVFTNLTQDHLDYHGDMETYGQVKLKLFNSAGLNAVVLNLDDSFSDTILESLSSEISVVGVTLNPEKRRTPGVDVLLGKVVQLSDKGMTISVESSIGNGEFNTSLLGDFNVTNLLTVFACAMKLGMAFDEVCQRLSQVKAPAGRLERFGGGSKPLVVVDYAHSPDALEKVLITLKKHAAGKLLVLMGCGGDRDQTKRPEMGAVAEAHSDVVWLTNDNPRSESPAAIVNDILKGFKDTEKVFVELDRETAIRGVVSNAKKNDVVLIAGKGHEDYQIVGDQRLDFSDRKIVAELLGENVGEAA